jgi:hypothetical protein
VTVTLVDKTQAGSTSLTDRANATTSITDATGTTRTLTGNTLRGISYRNAFKYRSQFTYRGVFQVAANPQTVASGAAVNITDQTT